LTTLGCIKQPGLTHIQKRELREFTAWRSDRKESTCISYIDEYYNKCVKDHNDFYILRINNENAHFMCVGNLYMGRIYENEKRIPRDEDRQKSLGIKLICHDNINNHKLHILKYSRR